MPGWMCLFIAITWVYFQTVSTTVHTCGKLTYGKHCEFDCTKRRCWDKDSSCDPVTGACPSGQCIPPYKGSDCRFSYGCTSGLYGAFCEFNCTKRNCRNKAATCNAITGSCGGQCETNWKGVDCIVSESCIYGNYGDYCARDCSKRRCLNKAASCDDVTGSCQGPCESGWRGIDCAKCEYGKYGVGCSRSCDKRHCRTYNNYLVHCDSVTGSCDGYCTSWWRGADCTECIGAFGMECEFGCVTRFCLDNAAGCDRWTGTCVGGCRTGWVGRNCLQCDRGLYGRNCSRLCEKRHCLNEAALCYHGTGSCEGGCASGWTGVTCLNACDYHLYGPNCALSCSERYCRDTTSSCDRFTGSCEGQCQDKWMGIDCREVESCTDGSYGTDCTRACSSRHCLDRAASCDPETGSCQGGCAPGWTSLDCTTESCTGMYGPGCKLRCDLRRCEGDSSVCDKTDGKCENGCQSGWMNPSCNKSCKPGSYGTACELQCENRNCQNIDDNCDPTSGSCQSQCASGWTGYDCSDKTGTSSSMTTIVIGISGAAVFIVLVIAIGICLRHTVHNNNDGLEDRIYHSKHSKHSKQHSKQHSKDSKHSKHSNRYAYEK